MFGIGSMEFLIIILVAVVVLGPDHLPKIMRTVNKTMSEFRRITTDFQRTLNAEAHLEELEKKRKELEKQVLATPAPKKNTATVQDIKTSETKPEESLPEDTPNMEENSAEVEKNHVETKEGSA